ncbi:MAG: M23 family metallopeptidase [Acutalibacteraceae bacterium]|nr:M23 family metallopeptidase [Acutalibacteraceae bacterium]
MDYDFQQPTSRTERDEYRSRFKFTDEDEPKRKSKKIKAKSKTDYLIRLILLQCVLCTLIVSGVFIASKISPSAFEKIRNNYMDIMQKDMSADEIVEQLKGAAEYVFTPQKDVPAISGNVTVESYEVTSDETGATVAVGGIVDASGGGDIEAKEAVKGTSFAPYFISVEPVLPVKNGRITSKFGYRTNPVSGKYGFHTGLDLAAAEGTPVSACFYGKIIETGSSDVWGEYVLMEHSDGLHTYYCHLSEIYVNEGAVIRQGETVGLVGSTGWSTGPHLHFEVRINGVRVNPEKVLYPDEA